MNNRPTRNKQLINTYSEVLSNLKLPSRQYARNSMWTAHRGLKSESNLRINASRRHEMKTRLSSQFVFANVAVLLWLLAGCVASRAQTRETIQLERFGFKSGSCDYRQSVQFLDDNRLLLSAPVDGVCDKRNWSSGSLMQLTVIDAQGNVLASKTRQNIYAMRAGPLGYAVACGENSLELVSGELATIRTLSTRPDPMGPCGGIDGLSPSRTAISIRDFGDSPKSFARHRLFRADLEQPIADRQFGKGDYLSAITESGYAVCASVEHRRCEQLAVDGSLWAGGGPQRASRHGLFLSPNQLLLPPDRTDKALMSLSPNGEEEQVVDLHKLQPPNVDSENIEISAEAPRRILYSATGCYLGDFDDCYGLNFERIAVFDPQTHQLLFEEKVGRNATSIISPNGHTVVVLDGSKLQIHTIP